MSNKMLPFFMLCETPLHVGVGSDVGIVDMPIQRERHTNWPKIEASGIKGCIRSAFEKKYKDNIKKQIDINVVFGYDENGLIKEIKDKFGNDKDFSGSLGFTDARILLFPVKSLKGIFAWVTCPAVLDRLKTDLKIAGTGDIKFRYKEKSVSEDSSCLICKNENYKIVLEEYTIDVDKEDKSREIIDWLSDNILPDDEVYKPLKKKMKKDIIVLDNDSFNDFVKLSTEVITRTKIDNATGTVKNTGLFTEEYLPTETIMYSTAIISPIFSNYKGFFNQNNSAKEIKDFFIENINNKTIQIGGNSTLGKGLTSIKILEKSEVS